MTSLASMRAALAAATLIAVGAYGQDPKAPPGGFAIAKSLDNPMTYSDGYKTLVDVRLPKATPGSKGWPVAMVFHGHTGSRKKGWVVTLCERLSRFGYVAIAYDTGGEGATKKLNPPGGRIKDLRIRDIVEVLLMVEAKLGKRMDETRLCSTGKSAGGEHALWTAAYSGRTLPKTSARATKMPVFRCAHSDIQVIYQTPDTVPGGNTLRAKWAAQVYDLRGANDPLTQLVISQDWPKIEAYVDANVDSVYSELKQSDVPLFVSYAWDDSNHFVNVNADAWPGLKKGVPRRFAMLTGGHGSQSNNTEATLRNDMIQRWMDRFAKGYQNGIDKEPFAEIALIPDSPVDYRNGKLPWKHRRLDQWPPRSPRTRFYLRGGNKLSPNKPTAVEPGPRIEHRVQSGYDMLAFMKQQMKLPQILAAIPFKSVAFDGPALSEDSEILGRTTVTLDVLANNKSFQLQAALYDVGPGGQARFITSGHAAKWNVVPGRHRLSITLGDTAYVIAKGHKLRVALENLNIRRQPGNAHLFATPYFDSVDMTVQIDPAFAPHVDLPIKKPEVSLLPRIQNASAAAGISAQLRVDGEGQRSGRPYMLFVSASGTAPGLNLPPRIPLNIDAWTVLGISLANTPVFDRFIGVLDANGQGNARFSVPAALAGPLAGTRLSVAGLIFGPGGTLEVTQPGEIVILP